MERENCSSRNRLEWIVTTLLAVLLTLTGSSASLAQTPQQEKPQLTFVAVLSRHGVRPPTDDFYEFNKYSAVSWPKWSVHPGYLTPHGFELLRIFGSYYQSELAAKGLLEQTGCSNASEVTFVADRNGIPASDERTQKSAEAIAAGMFPHCTVPVSRVDLSSFDFPPGINRSDRRRKTTGDVYGTGLQQNLSNLIKANRPQIVMLEDILKGCGKVTPTNPNRVSLLDLLNLREKDKSGYAVNHLGTATGIVEDLLLEYTDGMKDPGWGCVDANKLRYLSTIGTVIRHLSLSVPQIRVGAASFLVEILRSMQQSVSGKQVPGALGKPGDKLLFLMGHDGNVFAVGQALGMHWYIGGQRDGTPPGGALKFELWKNPDGSRFVRVFFTAQTLEQMRNAEPLSAANPPVSVPLFIPNCGTWDDSCSWAGFQKAMQQAMPRPPK